MFRKNRKIENLCIWRDQDLVVINWPDGGLTVFNKKTKRFESRNMNTGVYEGSSEGHINDCKLILRRKK